MGSPALVQPSAPGAGIHVDLTRETYDTLGERVNFSTAKEMAKSPAHYLWKLSNKDEDTQPRKLGRMTHLAVFEPEVFAAKVRCSGLNRNSNAWKDFLADAEEDGCEVLKPAEHNHCAEIAAVVRGHPVAGKYVRGGQGEVTLLWTHASPNFDGLPGYALDCRARVDYLAPGFISDLKGVRDASPEGFGKACVTYLTYVQAGIYREAVRVLTGQSLPYYLLAVESVAPYVTQVYEVPERLLAKGLDTARSWFDRIHACRRDGKFPGYAEAELELTLPRWADPEPDETDLSETGLIFPKE